MPSESSENAFSRTFCSPKLSQKRWTLHCLWENSPAYLCLTTSTRLVFSRFLDLCQNLGNVQEKASFQAILNNNFQGFPSFLLSTDRWNPTILGYINTKTDCSNVAFFNLDCKVNSQTSVGYYTWVQYGDDYRNTYMWNVLFLRKHLLFLSILNISLDFKMVKFLMHSMRNSLLCLETQHQTCHKRQRTIWNTLHSLISHLLIFSLGAKNLDTYSYNHHHDDWSRSSSPEYCLKTKGY